MQPGRESQTAVMVCAARAAAHGRARVPEFSDPTALTLLPDDARRRVEHLLAGRPGQSLRERIQLALIEKRGLFMVPRTVVIDSAIRAAASAQVVILGAGLDGRAWRMPELAQTTVFEVDHPDSQQRKRARVTSLTRAAREIRFVPVDFTRDRLDDALAAAGHDPALQTTWVWEGVVMYLERSDVEATLRVIEARSKPGSRLVVMYQSPSLVRKTVGLLLSLVGEPFRSAFTAEDMRSLLAGFGFTVLEDEDLARLGARLSSDIDSENLFLKSMRIVTAERR